MKRPQRVRRRVIVQLAALVDLLFVVFFLQYTQIRQSALHAIERGNNADKLKATVLADQEKLRRERDELRAENDKLQHKLAESEEKSADAQKRARDQIVQIAQAAKEVFAGVDPKILAEQMQGASEEQRVKVLNELKQAQGKTPAGLIQSFRKSAELQKRCDIWEVHLSADGRVRVRAPDLQDRTFVPGDENDFSNEFMQIVREAREPRSLVLILFTHGNAEARALRTVTKGLEQVRTIWGAQVRVPKSVQLAAPMYSEDPP
jgi:hypothetical protein